MSKVRVGIIGAGNIAWLHARGYANAPNAQLRAVCDANGDRARERALHINRMTFEIADHEHAEIHSGSNTGTPKLFA